MVVKACALALREHPRANGSYRDGTLALHSRINVGVAVAAQDALVVPTVFDADAKALGEIARETRSLAARVRDATITPPELGGGTFTVSNLGMYGIKSFTAIINPPQAAILSVGAVQQRAVVHDGRARRAPHDDAHARLRSPRPLRRRRRRAARAHPRAAAGARRADAVSAPPGSTPLSRALPAEHALRELRDADSDELHALIERNRARLAHWIHWAHDADPAGHARVHRPGARDGAGRQRTQPRDRAIALRRARRRRRHHRRPRQPTRPRSATGSTRPARGNGVMTAAVAALVEDGFERYRLVRVEIRADVANRASCAVAERLGFELEGVLRQGYRVTDERYSDDAVYSLLAGDPARQALGARASVGCGSSRRNPAKRER